ncbi:MAG: rRNA pseudouridine synthase [Lachnospiraceae bacterium]|nr:rRNA pseudouridine synthase [Lachnospiraceae bacterium]
MRLNKYLAECGICSRRGADRLIQEGRVLVNGAVAEMGLQVDGSEEIFVNGERIGKPEKTVIYLYHKPAGVVCTQKDPHAERTLESELQLPVRVTYAGRLDKDSRGLLILTNDGDLIEEMMRGANAHEKEYLVRVDHEVTADFLEKMKKGVFLQELKVKTRPCFAEKTGRDSFRIVLTQGLNRQIRRMCAEFGYRVEDLLRIRVVNLQLGDLKEGDIRQADESEIRGLRAALEKEDGRNAKKDNRISKRGSAQYD